MQDQLKSLLPPTMQRLYRQARWMVKATRADLRAAKRWRGERPAVCLHWESMTPMNPIWHSYLTDPPLPYAPSFASDLRHWIMSPTGFSARPVRKKLPVFTKPHVVEVEHMLVLAEHSAGFVSPLPKPMWDWHLVREQRNGINEFLRQDGLRVLLTFSNGLVEHAKTYADKDVWAKMDFVYPSFPAQEPIPAAVDRPFTILVIASRFSDKGLPEVFQVHERLRQRYGPKVQLLLVSQAVPEQYAIPDGVTHHNIPMMSPQMKAEVYRSADVLLLPNYGETVGCFPEAYAFGVPVVTTRTHHGDEFVQPGVTGFLLDTPIFAFSEKFGREWRTAADFYSSLDATRSSGKLKPLVEQAVDYLDGMISGQIDHRAMGNAAREFHARQFSPEARNDRLRSIYKAALWQ